MSQLVVEIQELSRRFGSSLALNEVSLQITAGQVVGLVGANGAGKTTLMKHLLGLLTAKTGSVRVFGYDPVRDPVAVLSRLGYLSEERELPEWMTVGELLSYTAAFYPKWDTSYAQELLSTFGLPTSKKVKQLSKGMRAQAGLIAAVAHHPQLLLLDEPSTGLDAVVRKDILNALVRTVAEQGHTALFSSHLLDEVELMSDYVFMIDQGQLILQGSLDEIRERHQYLNISLPQPQAALPPQPELLSTQGNGRLWSLVYHGTHQAARQAVQAWGAMLIDQRPASLQEIFVSRVRK